MRIIKKLFNELEVGALAVNDGPGFRAEHLPFGGVKDSGSGREGIKYAIEDMSYLKTLIL
jgi:acyl-CoA reductase-like NAD-dependent aldehyde dehydrogenase